MDYESNNKLDLEIENLLKSVAEEEGLQKCTIQKASGTLKGDGYLGVITAVEIIDSINPQNKLQLVIKSASKSDALRNGAPIADIFQREIYMYEKIIPALRAVEAGKGLPPLSSFAKCYKTAVTHNCEFLILENLKSKGFRLWERQIPMNKEHVTLVLKEYGRLHSLSLALKDQNPEDFYKLTKSMDDLRLKFYWHENVEKFSKIICGPALKALCPTKDSEAIKAFKRVIDTSSEYLSYVYGLNDDYSAVLHGDGWTNNILFAYDDVNSPTNPTKLCFIDLQLARLGPPVLDLVYFFYACSPKDVITNFEQYLDIYYNSLSTNLIKLGSDPTKLYPYSIFRQQWKDLARYGLLLSAFLIKLMLSEETEAGDLAESADSGKHVMDAFDYDLAKADEYNDRVRHLILHFVENKFI